MVTDNTLADLRNEKRMTAEIREIVDGISRIVDDIKSTERTMSPHAGK